MRSWLKLNAAVVCLLCLTLLPPAGASAAGSGTISGYAVNGQVTFFYTARYVTNPASPGPEVAFNQSYESAPTRLFLASHDCNRGGWGPV